MAGKEVVRMQTEAAYGAFSDYHIELTNVVASKRQFAAQLEFNATHDGPFLTGPGASPIEPTGKKVRTRGIFVCTVKKGKITEVHQYPDVLGVLLQIGAIELPNAGG